MKMPLAQVRAISTHSVQTEFDFYTAVDDLQEDSAGAGMLGTIEFNASTLYRYANVAVHALSDQLRTKTPSSGPSACLWKHLPMRCRPEKRIPLPIRPCLRRYWSASEPTARSIWLAPLKNRCDRDGYGKESIQKLLASTKKWRNLCGKTGADARAFGRK